MKHLFTAVLAAGLVLTGGTAAHAAAPRALNVATLGDSYAAGTGAGDYQAGTEGNCWRSAHSASAVEVAKLRSFGVPVNWADVACSGATTQDLYTPFNGFPAQLDSLTASTDVVVLTVGANDIGFASYGGLCIEDDCTAATPLVLAQIPAMQASLTTLLHDIHTRSPHAFVVLGGYGQQFTPSPNAEGVALDPICADGVITPQERLAGNQVASALDQALRGTAHAASVAGIPTTYVTPYNADSTTVRPSFAGHSLCEALPSYYRGLDALGEGQEGIDAVLHLNADGQAALAGLAESAFAYHH